MTAIAALLPDGRLHLQHGPIDCLCRAWGDSIEIQAAYNQAVRLFATILDDLCIELPLLRTPLPTPPPAGAIARAMHTACTPFADRFITPMAAVAGAVADAVLAAMVRGRDLPRAFVNNGGDIAFHLAPGTLLRCGLVSDIAIAGRVTAGLSSCVMAVHGLDPGIGPATHDLRGRDTGPSWVTGPSPVMTQMGNPATTENGPLSWPPPSPSWPGVSGPPIAARAGRGAPDKPGHDEQDSDRTGRITPDGTFLLTAEHSARGLATSGRACKGHGGRSFSLGIADSVTILARTAAQADAAATIIGNAVDLPGHPSIDRRPASQIDPASDLGDRLITFDVGPLSDAAIDAALDAGETMADTLLRDGLIEGAVLALRGHLRIRHTALALLEPA